MYFNSLIRWCVVQSKKYGTIDNEQGFKLTFLFMMSAVFRWMHDARPR